MKAILSALILLSFNVYAVDPIPSSPGDEKVKEIQESGGAIKVEKQPVHIEGLPPENSPEGKKLKKKNKKMEKEKKESH